MAETLLLDENGDIDIDWWMTLSDEEAEAICQREYAEYGRWFNALTTAQQIAHCRRTTLESCRAKRRHIRSPHAPQVIRERAREGLRENQVHLLRLRAWRATGTYPGSA